MMDTTVPDLPDADVRARAMRGVVVATFDHPVRSRRPARRLVRLGMTAAAAALVAIGFALADGGTSSALAVTSDDGWLELDITDGSASAQTLTDELHDAGIRGEVRTVPVAPADVGKWAAMDQVPDSGAVTAPAAADGDPSGPLVPSSGEAVPLLGAQVVFYDRKPTLRLRIEEVRRVQGSYVFYVGRAAEPGETYAFPREAAEPPAATGGG
jgi:hypothetical protein